MHSMLRYGNHVVMKSAADLSIEELSLIGRDAGYDALQEAFEKGVAVIGIENGKRTQYFADGSRKNLDGPGRIGFPKSVVINGIKHSRNVKRGRTVANEYPGVYSKADATGHGTDATQAGAVKAALKDVKNNR